MVSAAPGAWRSASAQATFPGSRVHLRASVHTAPPHPGRRNQKAGLPGRTPPRRGPAWCGHRSRSQTPCPSGRLLQCRARSPTKNLFLFLFRALPVNVPDLRLIGSRLSHVSISEPITMGLRLPSLDWLGAGHMTPFGAWLPCVGRLPERRTREAVTKTRGAFGCPLAWKPGPRLVSSAEQKDFL